MIISTSCPKHAPPSAHFASGAGFDHDFQGSLLPPCTQALPREDILDGFVLILIAAIVSKCHLELLVLEVGSHNSVLFPLGRN